jgi:hypothetical protein
VHSIQSINNKTDSNTKLPTMHSTMNPYLNFPKLSWPVFLKCAKLNHLVIRTFTGSYSLKDRILEAISISILFVGILGITGSEYRAWPDYNFVFVGLLGGLIARVFHSWYSALQVKQKRIPNEFSSESKLVRMVEAEVIRRLNIHRITRRTLGYFIMLLYYTVNIYYCVEFFISFSPSVNLNWTLAFFIAVFFESLVLEFFIVLAKIQAVNYLKVGGNDFLETISRMMIDEKFLKSFN